MKMHCVLQEFPWIATEKDFFGRPGSDYDFEAQDVPAAFAQYEAANESLQRLANKVNSKVRQCSRVSHSKHDQPIRLGTYMLDLLHPWDLPAVQRLLLKCDQTP